MGTIAGNPTDEFILDVTTDAKGNVYLLYTDEDSLLNADGHPLPGYGRDDILLSSFTCDGSYRWSKVIGTSKGFDRGVAVKTDAGGGVYVCGMMSSLANSPGHIAGDTTIVSNGSGRNMFLAKWDTSGAFKWVRMPQPDTISRYNADTASLLIDMDVDAQQGCCLLAYLTPGTYGGGSFVVTTKGMYVLRYGPVGQFISGTAIPIVMPNLYAWFTTGTQIHLNYDASRSRFIITGNVLGTGTTVGGSVIPSSGAYVATFDASTGSVGILKATTAGPSMRIPGRAKTDAQGNIYISGTAYHGTGFNGVSFSYPQVYASRIPFAMKMDATTGNALWTQSAHTTGFDDASGCAIAVVGNRVMMGGNFIGKLIFPTDSFSNTTVDGQDCFIAQIDATTGALQRTETFGGPGVSLQGPGLMDILFKIETDKRGNFYVVGLFNNYMFSTNTLTVGGTTLQSAGWADAFVAKLGWANCNCTPPAAPTFTLSKSSGKSVRLTYTSVTAGVDSLVWDFGDGQRQTVYSGFTTQFVHNYAADGYYKVCVTSYADTCGGAQTYCMQTALAVGVSAALGNVKVYPNPTGDKLTIEAAEGATISVANIIGQPVMRSTIISAKEIVNLGGLVPGIYLLTLQDKGGERATVRITKN